MSLESILLIPEKVVLNAVNRERGIRNPMGNLKRSEIQYCPICGENASTKRKGPISQCTSCGLEFTVQKRDQEKPKNYGQTHLAECGKKKPYETLEEAFSVADVLPSIPNRVREAMVIYQCRWCLKFHLGHNRKKGKKNINTPSYSYYELKDKYDERH